ncbi:hypothetical protein RJT34_16969 [Clitoria ternatea]|uniref:Phytocyanin domain-containing protein n=1 Tax=Clitoria ternatea TaxID=43366 RepID=A0AAN9J9D0_CLITE
MNKMSTAIGGVVAILMLLQYAEAQTLHLVGSDIGWRVPPDNSTYLEWASDNNFAIGDILMFNFTNGHNVIEVSEGSYNSCSSSNPIGRTFNIGPVNITLDRNGQHYYICGIGQHCSNGQRLAIDVSGSPSSATPPTSTATPPPLSSSALTSFPTLCFPLFFLFPLITIMF